MLAQRQLQRCDQDIGRGLRLGRLLAFALLALRLDLRQIGAAPGHRLERLVLVLRDRRHPELVDRVGQQQHLDAAGPEALELRRGLDRLQIVAGDGVDRLLAVLHALQVFGQAGPALTVVMGAAETQQRENLFAVLVVLIGAFLQHRAELGPELGIGVRFLLGPLADLGQHPLGQPLADLGHHRVVLQHLAADVQGQILAVDDAAQKAQIGRQQPLGLVRHEDPADIQLHPVLAVRMEQVEGGGGRDEQQGGVFDLALGPVMQPQPGLVEGVCYVVIELLVVVVADLVARPGPQGGGPVQGLVPGRLAVLAFRWGAGQDHRNRDVVGMGLDGLPQPLGFEELVLPLGQVQDHPRAAGHAAGFRDGELAPPVRQPAPALRLAGLAGQHRDLVGDHEGGIEADAELADQGDVVLRLAAHGVEEGGGTGARDGAQVFQQVVAVHADAVIGDGQGAGLFVDGQRDPIGAAAIAIAVGDQIRLGQRRVAQLVAGVGGVGDQLAEEDLLLAVEGFGHDIQQPADLGLELQGFLAHRCPGWQVDLVFRQICAGRRGGATPAAVDPGRFSAGALPAIACRSAA